MELDFKFNFIADGNTIYAAEGNRGLESPGPLDRTRGDSDNAKPALLIEGKSRQIIVCRDAPQSTASRYRALVCHRLEEC